jgi:hypothetical protein
MPPTPFGFGVIPPRCTAAHDGAPAVVFSTGGCGTNFFHAMSDLVVPLYITAREYGGRVHLLVTDYRPEWVAKFRPVLDALSAHPVVDLTVTSRVYGSVLPALHGLSHDDCFLF